jgi:hypothetical protein
VERDGERERERGNYFFFKIYRCAFIFLLVRNPLPNAMLAQLVTGRGNGRRMMKKTPSKSQFVHKDFNLQSL